MGIFGLTSYVSEHASELLKPHKLHDCSVLIDGYAAASIIYSHYTKCTHAFGGDYDKFANSVIEFVDILKKCNIYACFVFDGGYEKRKLKTVIDRLKLNIAICSQFKNKYRESKCFPLLLRDVFKDILRSINVPVIQCDFEADQELVVLARTLNCPVISNDSDFYVSNVAYIPFFSIEFKAYRLSKKIKDKYYIPCSMYHVDDLLNKFEGLPDKSLLPLMSCALGNDYIPPHTFKNFLRISYSSKLPKRMEKILYWLRGVIFADMAIEELVSCAPKKLKGGYRKLIKQLLTEFNSPSSQLLEHIPDAFHINCELADVMNNLSINDDNEDTSQNISHTEFEMTPVVEKDLMVGVGEDSFLLENNDEIEIIDSCEYEIEDENDEHEIEADSSINTSNVLDSSTISTNPTPTINLPEWVVRKFRLGLLSPTVMNIHTFKRIIIQSQSEDYHSPPSHLIITPILQIIIAIVLGKKGSCEVKCHARLRSTVAGIYKLTPVFSFDCDLEVPSLEEVANLSDTDKQTILLKCLNIDENLSCFPNEWKIFMIAVFYWLKNSSNLNQTHIRSVILSLIYLSIIDKKIGSVRTQQELNRLNNVEKKKKTEAANEPLNDSEQRTETENTPCFDYLNNSQLIDISEIVNLVSGKDCITAANALLHYHHLDSSLMQNRKNFNTKLVHCYAQLQHCLQAVGLLNAVLDFPFAPCMVHNAFSGTFLYNFYTDMSKRKLADGYITRTLLSKATDIIVLYKYLMKTVTCSTSSIKDTGCSNSEKKKKKSRGKNIMKPSSTENEVEKEESFIDAENIYSMLSLNDCNG
ncbi:protein asteroid [Planococcus citri]|uniref:protein asteroid n=1 Tax=Planococcus citri TaxID=170843 RepID=UPI0031F9EE4C